MSRAEAISDLRGHLDTLVAAVRGAISSLNSILLDQQRSGAYPYTPDPYRNTYIADALTQLEEKIPALSALENDILPIVTSIHKQCNSIAPIHHLPDEILVDIFHAIPSKPGYLRIANSILVSHVCERWRDLALGTGTLWSAIEFLDNQPYPIAKMCVSRSMGCGMDVVLKSSKGTTTSHNRHTIDLISAATIALPAADRWRELTLECTVPSEATQIITQFLAECQPDPPQLRSLCLYAYMHAVYIDADLEKALFSLSASTALTKLHFKRVRPPRTTSLFANLTQLILEDIIDFSTPVSRLRAILAACTQLHVLQLDKVCLGNEHISGSSDILFILPALVELSIDSCSEFVQKLITDYLITPALRTLRVGSNESAATDKSMTYFFERNNRVQTLGLRFISPRSHDVISALSGLSDVHSLTIGSNMHPAAYPDTTFLGGLLHSMPKLTELRVEGRVTLLELNAMKRFIETRVGVPGIAPLHELYFAFSLAHLSQQERERTWTWFEQKIGSGELVFGEVD
ncbi:hypothetical protein BOTBODRAFT_31184 [Botryobasidium botryosum FD-172 SS1]|uniref:F-box domain-containing protein n=1 Tax=Botryobasidium botryosum (strain FD-172 SS1) TaxID=930990 RepID=A0A067MX32_BOTB1|nr:hypothetical protein BOTBODRAFT_31184 [Botryobasidium botryosum FD-172 SS1]